jgi:hypothetical protein
VTEFLHRPKSRARQQAVVPQAFLPVFRVTLLPSRFSNGRKKNGSPQEFDRTSILGRFLSPAGAAAERGCDFENGIVRLSAGARIYTVEARY